MHHVQLTRKPARDHGEIRELALKYNPNGSLAHRIAGIQERIAKVEFELEFELVEAHRQLHYLDKQQMTTEEIREALIDFDCIWGRTDDSRPLALLVFKVAFDQSDYTIAIAFHATCIATLEQ